MGVDYSATVAYGIVVDDMGDLKDDRGWVDPDEVNAWLERNEYKEILFDQCGNLMNGDYVDLFYLKDTHKCLDWRDANGYINFNTPDLTGIQFHELYLLCSKFGLDTAKDVSWKLAFNVS